MNRDEAWAAEPSAPRGGIDMLSLIPLVAIVIVVAMVAALVWIVSRDQAERARTQLATDALWVEQTLRFQLSIDEDMLVRLALDSTNVDPDTIDARARLHVANNPEVLRIAWFDGQGHMVRSVPTRLAADAVDPLAVSLLARANAAASSRPVYGPISAGDRPTVTMAVRPAAAIGLITFTISLPLMLERHIPWWIAEQYAVQLVDSGGTVLVARARAAPDPMAAQHAISFDPPLQGAILRIAPYQAASRLGNMLLLAAIAGLSAFAILALLVLYRSSLQRRRAESRLRGEMAFRRSMEESLTVGLRAKDHSGAILYVNAAFCGLVGWNAAELVGKKPPMPYWSSDRIDETLQRQAALANGGARSQSFETRFRRKDGTEIDVQVFEAPLIDAKGVHRGWMGSMIDITEAKRGALLAREQEDSLARTGRLVTLGEMASTLAHELNQPLAAIASYAAGSLNLLREGKADPETITPALEKLALQADRAGQIIRRIQDFVRKREPRFLPLSLPETIEDTISFLAADARAHGVTIRTDLAAVPPVNADRILLEQVLINLIRNGMEAMTPDGRAADTLDVRLRPTPDGAEISIRDRGPGIDPALADRLFDAFASTKSEGMGLGLKICRSIIELHRGQLSHQPAPDGGTVFIVRLPWIRADQRGQAAR